MTAAEAAGHRHLLRLVYGAWSEGLLPTSVRVHVLCRSGALVTDHILDGALHALRAIYTLDPVETEQISLSGAGGACAIDGPLDFVSVLFELQNDRSIGLDTDFPNRLAFDTELADSLANENRAFEARAVFHEMVRSWGGAADNLFTALAPGSHLRAHLAVHGLTPDRLLLRLGSFSGHRTHPAPKMRLTINEAGVRERLSEAQSVAYAPEFGGAVDLEILAVREACVTAQCGEHWRSGVGPAEAFRSIFAAGVPQAYTKWYAALRRLMADAPQDYLPLPIHPLQRTTIEARFAADIARGDILHLPGVVICSTPALSFRTLIPDDPASRIHIKTSLNMQMTSVVRTIAPARAFNAPVLSDVLIDCLSRAPDIAKVLRAVPEPASLYWGRDPDPASMGYQSGFQLGTILKADPDLAVGKDELAIPLNTLFAVSPLSNKRLIADVMRHAGVSSGPESEIYFRRYIRVVLGGDMRMLARFGIGLESHQQNIDMVFGVDGIARASLYRDISGGLEIYEPLLRANGIDILNCIHPVRRGVHDGLDVPVRQLLHTTYLSHLVPLVFVISQEFGLEPDRLFSSLADETEAVLSAEALVLDGQGRVFEETLAKIRRAVLVEPWQVKCLLRMRMAQTQNSMFRPMDNPLKR